MAATSAPAVKRALLALFQAAPALGGDVHVTYAHPGAVIQQEAIFFHRTVEHEDAKALGYQRRDEDYSLELIVNVAQDGDDGQLCEERCWTLVEALENLVRANPGKAGDALAGVVNGWVVWSSVEMTPAILPAQREAEAVCRITVKHRK